MEQRFYEGAQGLRLAADIGGPADGPAVILLHGGGQTRQSWGGTAQKLIACGYHVVTLDARGHGESGWAPGGVYDMDGFVGDIRAVVEQLPNKPALVGASLGGVTAMTAIGESSEPIARALVLVDIVPRMNREGAAKVQAFMRSAPDGFASVEEAAESVAAYLPHRKRPKNVEGLRRNLRLSESGRLHWHWDPAFMTPREWDPSFDTRLENAARNLKIPTLLVRGSLSEIVDDASVAHFLELAPEAEYVDVAGAGHMVAGDSNDNFNAAILTFLARTMPAS
jgi:pimeloyl-ACP methyl ester carboxylesterase